MLKDFFSPDTYNKDRFDKDGKYLFNKCDANMQHQGASQDLELFKKTKIFNQATNIVKEYQGQYPIIYLNFKDCGNESVKDIKSSLRSAISKTFKQHDYLLKYKLINEIEKILYIDENFRKYYEQTDKILETSSANELLQCINSFQLTKYLSEDLLKFIGYYIGRNYYKNEDNEKLNLPIEDSISFLASQLKNYFEKEVYILVDEYDKPAHNLLINSIHNKLDNSKSDLEEIVKLVSKIVGSEAKGIDSNVKNIILTGILNTVDKEVSSTLNKLKHITLSNEELTGYFGFSDEEVEDQVLSEVFSIKHFKTERPDLYKKLFNELKEWYNGYNFSGQELFNPFALMRCIDNLTKEKDPEKIFAQHWSSTFSDNVINSIFTSELLTNEHHFKQDIVNTDAKIKLNIDKSKTLYELVKDNNNQKTIESMKMLLSTLMVRYGYFTEIKNSNTNNTYKVTSKELELKIKQGLKSYITNKYSININDFLPTFNKVFQDLNLTSNDHTKEKLESFSSQLKKKISDNYKTDNNKNGSIDKINEHLLHDIILCIIVSSDLTKSIRSDSKFGNDKRPDIVFEIENENLGIILELKYNKSTEIALNQIKSKKYEEGFITKKDEQELDQNENINHILGIGVNISDENENIEIELDFMQYDFNKNGWGTPSYCEQQDLE